MNDRERLTQQMADIGNRYLKRTLGELDTLRGLLAEAGSGKSESVKEIERISHKIHGSGAMFGFDAIGERAREIELLAEGGAADTQTLQRLEGFVKALDEAVTAAARARGIE